MKEIALSDGKSYALVDDEDYEELSKYRWHMGADGYASRSIPHPSNPRKRVRVSMHRQLLGLSYGDPRYGDHADNNRLNNSRKNLRICTMAQNLRNSVRRSDNTSGFKGVSLRKSTQKWEARITYVGRLIRLGCFDNPQDAHNAYCEAALKLHGEFANVGTSDPELSEGRILDVKPKRQNKTGFIGVTKERGYERWRAAIRHNGTRIHLGCFNSPEDARAAICEAEQKIRDGSVDIKPETVSRVRPNKTGYTGVKKMRDCDRWEAYIKIGGKKKYLGSFSSPEAAHDAYCRAVQKRMEGTAEMEKAA